MAVSGRVRIPDGALVLALCHPGFAAGNVAVVTLDGALLLLLLSWTGRLPPVGVRRVSIALVSALIPAFLVWKKR